jgi:hypothetical protein
MLSYKILAPMLLPKIAENCPNETIQEYGLIFNKDTGKVVQILTTKEKGSREYVSKVDINEVFQKWPMSMVKSKIEKAQPEANEIVVLMDTHLKKIFISYTKNDQVIHTNVYE